MSSSDIALTRNKSLWLSSSCDADADVEGHLAILNAHVYCSPLDGHVHVWCYHWHVEAVRVHVSRQYVYSSLGVAVIAVAVVVVVVAIVILWLRGPLERPPPFRPVGLH